MNDMEYERIQVECHSGLCDVAAKCDLNVFDMMTALKDRRRYKPRLNEAIKLTGVPTLIINNKYKIVGAQPVDVFKEIFSIIRS